MPTMPIPDDDDASGWGTDRSDPTLSLAAIVIALVALLALWWYL